MGRVDLECAQSAALDAGAAAGDLVGQLRGGEPALCVAFASPRHEHARLAKELKNKLPPRTRLVYATTAAPICARGGRRDGVVLAALSGDLEVGLGVGRGLASQPIGAGTEAAVQAASDLGVTPREIPTGETVGLVIDDAWRWRKEEFLLGILDANPALHLVGGGAGGARAPGPDAPTVLGIDGEVGPDAGVVALLRTRAQWRIFRHHAYRPTGETLKITKVDESYTQVQEIDGRPAAEAYAARIGVAVGDLEFGKPDGFSRHPTAMQVGREYFMCSPWTPLPDGSIFFANRILPNTELEIMRRVDMVQALRRFLETEIPAELGAASSALYFNCYGRYLIAEALGIAEELEAAYARGPSAAGMNSVFEIFGGFQVNTTLTALAFGPGR